VSLRVVGRARNAGFNARGSDGDDPPRKDAPHRDVPQRVGIVPSRARLERSPTPSFLRTPRASPRRSVPSFSFARRVRDDAAFYLDERREVPEELELTRRSFMLRDPEYGVAYEGFALHLVGEGSVVEIRDCVLEAEAEAAAAEARELQAELGVGPQEYFAVIAKPLADLKRAPSDFSETDDEREVFEEDGDGDASAATKNPSESSSKADGSSNDPTKTENAETKLVSDEPFTEDERRAALEWAMRVLEYRRSTVTMKQRTWRMLDEPGSSKHAAAFTCFMLTVIIFSTCTFCVETLPQYYQPKTVITDKFFVMEAVCISAFTAEFVARLWATPDLKTYFYDRMNVVDVVAIVPFYLELALRNVDIPGLSVFRVFRLVRVFRLFKASRGSLTIFGETMTRSAKPLYMLIFFTSIATIIASSLMYYAERGKWNPTLGLWMRPYVWYCPVVAGASEGPASKTPETFVLESGLPEPCVWVDPGTYAANHPEIRYPSEALFNCPFAYEKSSDCVATYEQSPFDSIPTTFWWCLVTMTTVGYGDVVPTQASGQFLGGLVMIFGIIVIALPITVIGSNFANIYKAHVSNEGLSSEERDGLQDGDDLLTDDDDDDDDDDDAPDATDEGDAL